MIKTGWQFLPVRPEAMSQDPTQQEFFGPEEGSPGALVREAIQNSLDAKRQDAAGAVTVRFTFGNRTEATYGNSKYFDVLRDHLSAQPLALLPQPNAALTYLVIEDFGTRGLQGDPEHTIYDEQQVTQESRNDFFYFWRNVGRSRKEETERGRWGLGKTVFPASSTLSSFFGLTVRKSDGRRLLMGQTVGTTHTYYGPAGEKTIYEPYGYYGSFVPETPLALPIEEAGDVQAFMDDFRLTRGTEPGLSIVVPFPQRELTPEALMREAIRSYYVPILTGELVIETRSPTENYEVTAGTLREMISVLDWRAIRTTSTTMLGLVDFADKCLQVEDSAFYSLAPQPPTPAPESLKGRIPEHDLDDLRARYDAGELLPLRVPVIVKRETGPVDSYLDLFIQRDEDLNSGTADFVREGLAITQTGKAPRQQVRGLALVTDRALSTLLGDAENPAHTKWQELSQKIKEPKYTHGRGTVRMVNASIQQVVEILAFRPGVRDLNLLADIFYLPVEAEAAKPVPVPKKSSDGEVQPPPVVPPPTPKPFKLREVAGGFRLESVEQAERRVETFSIRMAYALRSGDPFRHYSQLDFEAAKLQLRGEGVEVTEAHENRIVLKVSNPRFVFQVSGFDQLRDVEVDVTPTYSAETVE
jgi:hypothetical protein